MAAAIIASLLVAGTILIPMKSYAAGSRGGLPNTSSLKQGIRGSIGVNLHHRSQNMNQETLCYRTNTCRQSSVGENTLGNDNSVTGFADQSDNLKLPAPPITPTTSANQTTGNSTTLTPSSTLTPTQAPAPTTATLTVIKIVSGNTTATPSDFAIGVIGNNANPSNFNGSSGTDVTLGPGTFNVTESIPAGSFFTTSFTGDCDGTIAAGQHLTCTITNTPLTCEQCLKRFLTQADITSLIPVLSPGSTSIADACAALHTFTEVRVKTILVIFIGVSERTADELIDCLKASGIVFTP
jgi:Prealbumin-like fold domain